MSNNISVSSWLCLFSFSNAFVLGVVAPSYAESLAGNTISQVKTPTLKAAISIDEKHLSYFTENNYFTSSKIPINTYVFDSKLSNITVDSAEKLAQVQPVQTRDRQANPNEDRFPQTAPLPTPLPPDSQPPVQAPPSTVPLPSSTPGNQTIQVQKIKITGSTVFKPKDWKSIIQPLEGRTTSIQELENATNAITQLYLDRGYINSRAFLIDPKTADGLVEIRVIEGRVQRIEIEGTHRLNPSYIRSRVSLGVGTPLNGTKLEDQLRLLRTDPLFKNVEASLKAGDTIGESILVVRVTEASPWVGGVSIDNYSPPSIGSERFGVNLGDRNLTGIGDQFSASYYRTFTGGADVFDFNYSLPLNPMNGTLQLRYAPNSNKVTQAPFNNFDIHGSSQLYEISYRQPLVRTSRQEFALSLGFSYQDGQTFTFAGPTPFSLGPDSEGNSRTRVLKFGQDYVRRDVSGAWSLRSLFSIGLDVFNPTINSGNIPDGRFFSWLGQVQRLQAFSQDNFLILQAEAQLTPNGLLPSQQFVIGGGESLRGYRQNVRAGDNGVRFSAEDRHTLMRDETGASTLQFASFVDLGTVWNSGNNPNTLQGKNFLVGLGVGLIWELLPRLNVRVDYAIPLVDISDRGNNAQDRGLYFNVNYQL